MVADLDNSERTTIFLDFRSYTTVAFLEVSDFNDWRPDRAEVCMSAMRINTRARAHTHTNT